MAERDGRRHPGEFCKCGRCCQLCIGNSAFNEGGAGFPLAAEETQRLVEDIIDEVLGFGPLEALLREPSVSDILVNGYESVYVERFGTLEHPHSI